MEKGFSPVEQSVVRKKESVERYEKILWLRHRQSLAALRMEQSFDRSVDNLSDFLPVDPLKADGKVETETKETSVEPLSFVNRSEQATAAGFADFDKRVGIALSRYEKQSDKTQKSLNILQERADSSKKSLTDYLFFLRTKKNPSGVIRYELHTGYLVLAFADGDDYRLFTDGQIKSNIGRDSDGTFRLAIDLDGEKMELPTIIVRGISSSNTKSIVDHERQHFLNQVVFNWFSDPESKVGYQSIEKRSPLKIRGWQIKDEILAYLRDGSEKDRISDCGLYDKFNLSEDEKSFIALFFEIVEKNKIFVNFPLIRDLLVYDLLDVPFEKLLDRLNTFIDFYRQNIKEFLEYGSLVLKTGDFIILTGKLFSPNSNKRNIELKEALEIEEKITFCMDKVIDVVLGLVEVPGEKIEPGNLMAWLKTKIARHKKLFEKIAYSDGRPLPFLTEITGPVTSEAINAVLKFSQSFPQEKINDLIEKSISKKNCSEIFSESQVGLAEVLKRSGLEKITFEPLFVNYHHGISLKVSGSTKGTKKQKAESFSFVLTLSADDVFYKKRLVPILKEQQEVAQIAAAKRQETLARLSSKK